MTMFSINIKNVSCVPDNTSCTFSSLISFSSSNIHTCPDVFRHLLGVVYVVWVVYCKNKRRATSIYVCMFIVCAGHQYILHFQYVYVDGLTVMTSESKGTKVMHDIMDGGGLFWLIRALEKSGYCMVATSDDERMHY